MLSRPARRGPLVMEWQRGPGSKRIVAPAFRASCTAVVTTLSGSSSNVQAFRSRARVERSVCQWPHYHV